MSIFSDGDLFAFGLLTQDLGFKDVCDVQRKAEVPVSDGMGSSADGWTTITTVKAMVLKPTIKQLEVYAARIGTLAIWEVKLPLGTDVKHQDHLEINGQTLEVHAVEDLDSYAVFISVMASEVR